jgi:hypothetical protein
VDSLGIQVAWLFLLALAIASIAWTVTHEDLFREPREYAMERSRGPGPWYVRKFFYLFSCEYCFSHYVTIAVLIMTGYRLLLPGPRGFVLALFALVWVSNQYMSLFARLRLGIRSERVDIDLKQEKLGDEDPSARTP